MGGEALTGITTTKVQNADTDSYLPILGLSMIQGPPYIKPDLFFMRNTKRFWNEEAVKFCPVKVIKYWILTFSGVLSSMGGRWKIPWQWGSRAQGPDMWWSRGAQYWTSVDALVLEHTLNQRQQEGRKEGERMESGQEGQETQNQQRRGKSRRIWERTLPAVPVVLQGFLESRKVTTKPFFSSLVHSSEHFC